MPLVLVSFLGLFLELAFIRWVPANVFAMAYFSNTVLIAAFLGLGIGMLLARHKRDLFPWFPAVLAASVAVLTAFRYVYVYMAPSQQELLWNFHYVDNWMRVLTVHMGMMETLAVTFVATAAPFVPIGQRMAKSMEGLPPLRAYTLDVAGSLLGIIAFSVLGSVGGVWGSPVVWFAVTGIVAGWLLRRHRLAFSGAAAVTVLLVVSLRLLPDQANWSPYYSINVLKEPATREARIFVNRFLHQVIMDFERNQYAFEKYSYAYTLAAPKKVLVLGAGSGNDVATAELHGVESVTAVELDPVIAATGRLLHPQRPYQDPRTHLVIGDARAFLRQTKETYDMIVFGTLDSHALLSGLSTVRVENFVYTKEALEEAKAHLAPDGVAVILYSAPQQWLADKIVRLATTVFGPRETLVSAGDETFLYNLFIMAGPGVRHVDPAYVPPEGFAKVRTDALAPASIPTDDWPYLYLRSRAVPWHYVRAVGMLLALAAAGIWFASGKRLWEGRRWGNAGFFSLGAAFLLVETKSVTAFSLLFGTTWWVNAFVFGGILSMILAANAWQMKRPVERAEPWYAALFAALALEFLVPPSAFIGLPFLAAAFAALPVFFASVIFAHHVRRTEDIGSTLGVNLMGAVVGGFLEYGSMLTGLRFLSLLAGVLYLCAFLAFRRDRSVS